MATVSLRHVFKQYANTNTKNVSDDSKFAVNDFCMEIEDKEFIVFVGPSGCGKSTTLRMIAGLESISDGEIYIDDTLINGVEPKDRNIAMVFQNYALYPHMTVFNNMAFGLKLSRTPKEVRDAEGITVKSKSGKRLNFLQALFARTPLEKLDENGNVVYNYGKTEYVYKTNKDGSVKTDKDGNPVPVKRMYTLDELYGPIVCGEDGRPLYIVRKNRDGSDKIGKDGKPVYAVRRYTRQEIRNKVLEAAKILDIGEYLDRKPKALSGGQRQRVALGRTIVRNPKVFLLDEPLSNLDAKLRATMRSEIIKLHDRLGATFIYVTHDQIEAMTMGTRIVVMKDGHIMQIGSPAKLYKEPVNVFVAGFIGTPQMNFFDGRITPDGTVVFANNQSIVLDEKSLAQFDMQRVGDGMDIVIGIRPEDLKQTDKFVPGKCIKGRVNMSEPLGSETIIYADMDLDSDKDMDSSDTVIVANSKVRFSSPVGQEIVFEINTAKVHLFDRGSQKTIKL